MRETVGQAMDRGNPGGVLDMIFEPDSHHNMRNVDRDDINEQYGDFFEHDEAIEYEMIENPDYYHIRDHDIDLLNSIEISE